MPNNMRKKHERLDAIMRMINKCDVQLEYMGAYQHYRHEMARVSRIRNRLYSAYANQLTKMFQNVLR